MKFASCAVFATITLAAANANAQSTTVTPGGTQFYGNVVVTGSGGCSAIGTKIVFPATASYENVIISDATKQRFVLKTLAKHHRWLTLQYMADQFGANTPCLQLSTHNFSKPRMV